MGLYRNNSLLLNEAANITMGYIAWLLKFLESCPVSFNVVLKLCRVVMCKSRKLETILNCRGRDFSGAHKDFKNIEAVLQLTVDCSCSSVKPNSGGKMIPRGQNNFKGAKALLNNQTTVKC